MTEKTNSVFHEQAAFMQACGQAVGRLDEAQAMLYRRLMREEDQELSDAIVNGAGAKQRIDQIDACLDIIVVTIGYALSLGVPPDVLKECWDEVVRSNDDKVDPATGFVRKRIDGKVLKPEGWRPPDIAGILLKHGCI